MSEEKFYQERLFPLRGHRCKVVNHKFCSKREGSGDCCCPCPNGKFGG